MSGNTALLLQPIILVGAFLRLWQINALGLNTDEAVYAGQGASIAGDHDLQPFFPVFRAHPLLFQTLQSLAYRFGTSDMVGRVMAAAFGVAAILLVFKLGELLYGRRAGLIAAGIMAVMPYHVVVSRQVLLDGPLAFFGAFTLYTLAKYAQTAQPKWLYATGAAMGLTFLSKETGILMVAAVYAFLALEPKVKVRLRDLALSVAAMVAVILPFPVSLIFSGKSKTGGAFLSWQLFRRSNHSLSFYFTTVPAAIGYLVVLLAIVGLVVLRKQRTWRETLLLCWILVPLLFFEIWPVKGFQYLLPIAIPIALLAARTLAWASRHEDRRVRTGAAIVAVNVALTLLLTSLVRIQPSQSSSFLAGSGGVPGGREAGRWISEHVPKGARMLTVGPSMANILEFYGHRKAFGLSVSTNPLHRNPIYEPVSNPDAKIRSNELQYAVWDAFSASRSRFFGDRILHYANRYHGRAVHTEWVTDGSGPTKVRRPVIIVYEVRP